MSSSPALDGSKGEATIPRDISRARGDEGRFAVRETTLAAQGEILAAWDDLGMNFASAKGEVIIELEPVPMLRQ